MKTVDSLMKAWLRHRDALISLVEATPEGSQDYTPWDGAWTYAQLTLHIVGVGEWFVNAVVTGQLAKPTPAVQVNSMEQLREVVRETTKRTIDIYKTVTDEQLAAEVNTSSAFGYNLSGLQMIEAMREHEIHHKGQLFVYARLCGVVNPPFYVRRSE